MSTIIEKAHELGHALYESEEATILHAAELNLDQDPEAQTLISDFQSRQKGIKEAEEAKREVSDDEWDAINQLQDKMKGNKAILAYFAALEKFQGLIQEANAEINKVLGGDACSPSDCEGCSLECKQ